MMTDYYLEDKSRLKGQPFENFSYFPIKGSKYFDLIGTH